MTQMTSKKFQTIKKTKIKLIPNVEPPNNFLSKDDHQTLVVLMNFL